MNIKDADQTVWMYGLISKFVVPKFIETGGPCKYAVQSVRRLRDAFFVSIFKVVFEFAKQFG